MNNVIQAGTSVSWKWANGEAHGKVIEILHRSVAWTLTGDAITRDGTDENPTYLIRQMDGRRVLKQRYEIEVNSEC